MTIDRPEQLLVVLVVEAIFGYPTWILRAIGHPVIWFGRLIDMLDIRFNKGETKKVAGALTAFGLIILGGMLGLVVEIWASGWMGAVVIILIATTGLAQRSLHDHVTAVLRSLRTGDIHAARTAVALTVGRDTAALNENGISAAATETLAESFCDGIVAPAFWFLILGLPGLFAFKAISTADSMVGHLDARHKEFGWASARIDDVMNWVPARMSGVLLCLVGAGGWRIMLRDARKHLSPNAGWPESAMAGALKLQLGGGAAYAGEWIARDELGDGARPTPADLERALVIYRRACLLLWLAAAGVTGAAIWLR